VGRGFGTAGFCGFAGTDLLAVRNAARFEIRACKPAGQASSKRRSTASGTRFDDTHHVMHQYSDRLYDKIKTYFVPEK
jgi:hypothetical protein